MLDTDNGPAGMLMSESAKLSDISALGPQRGGLVFVALTKGASS